MKNQIKRLILTGCLTVLAAGCTYVTDLEPAKKSLSLSAEAQSTKPKTPVTMKVNGLSDKETIDENSFTSTGGRIYKKDKQWYFEADKPGDYQIQAKSSLNRLSPSVTIRVEDTQNNSENENAVITQQDLEKNNDVLEEYDVDSLLAKAQSLLGREVTVIGNLPQSLIPDDNGQLTTYLISNSGERLRFTGNVYIGSCKAKLTGTLDQEEGECILKVESFEQISSASPESGSVDNPEVTVEIPHQGFNVYDVDTVLGNAANLVGQRFTVIGNLPQNAPLDQDGKPTLWIISDTGAKLRFDGLIDIGSCTASLNGTLVQDGNGYIFLLDSYTQL